MAPVPILFVSDAIGASTGLARIARDLSTRLHRHLPDLYRVATFGYGSPGSSKFGFTQYNMDGMSEWVLPTLPKVWEDFAGSEKGIIFCIWDLARLEWFSQPKHSALLNNRDYLLEFLVKAPFKRWIYPPMDATGANDKLSYPLARILVGFDRIIAYSEWAGAIIDRSLARAYGTTPSLSHGIDSSVFYERNRDFSRGLFFSITGAQHLLGKEVAPIGRDEILVGVVATNQARKDWPLAIEAFSILAKERKARLWIHTDHIERYWSFVTMLVDFGVLDQTIISVNELTDDKMAQAYSACDVTIAPGRGEGFGYPIFESLFCGTPCVHGDYGGAPGKMEDEMLVTPRGFHYEGSYPSRRPVFDAEDFVDGIRNVIGRRATVPTELDWDHVWPQWEKWFREGVEK